MIHVDPRPEYPEFDQQVRQPGRLFLARVSSPNSAQFSRNNFWTRASRELHSAYSGICAYTCMYLVKPESIDHFIPKAIRPDLAYEWSNFRLAAARINVRKGNNTNLLDPFLVQNGWFTLEFPSCLVKPAEGIPPALRAQINTTITGLGLNQDEDYVQERCSIVLMYADGDISFEFLKRRYPFIAAELERQDLRENVATLFASRQVT